MSRRRKRGRLEMLHPELMLAAMVDMLVNILIFLLHLYGTAPIDTAQADLDLPESEATEPVQAAPIVMVTVTGVEAGGEPLATFATGDGLPGSVGAVPVYPEGTLESGHIPPLVAWLTERRASMLERDPEAEPNTLIIQCDRRVPWSVVTPVLSSAGSVGFTNFRFVVNTVTDVN